MGHKLEIELPPEVFEHIQRDALALGRTPSEQVVAEVAAKPDSSDAQLETPIVATSSLGVALTPVDLNDPLEQLFGTLPLDREEIQRQLDELDKFPPVEIHPREIPPGADPLERWFGSISGGPPDLFENHDYYIALEIARRKLGPWKKAPSAS